MDANTHNVPVYVEKKANVIKYFLKRKLNSLLDNVLISGCPLGFASILFVNDARKNHKN